MNYHYIPQTHPNLKHVSPGSNAFTYYKTRLPLQVMVRHTWSLTGRNTLNVSSSAQYAYQGSRVGASREVKRTELIILLYSSANSAKSSSPNS